MRYLYQSALRKVVKTKGQFKLFPIDQILMDNQLLKIVDHLKYTEQYHKFKKLYWNDFVQNYREFLKSDKFKKFDRKDTMTLEQ
jgi:hypothetical protein